MVRIKCLMSWCMITWCMIATFFSWLQYAWSHLKSDGRRPSSPPPSAADAVHAAAQRSRESAIQTGSDTTKAWTFARGSRLPQRRTREGKTVAWRKGRAWGYTYNSRDISLTGRDYDMSVLNTTINIQYISALIARIWQYIVFLIYIVMQRQQWSYTKFNWR